MRDGVTVLEGHYAFSLHSRIYHSIFMVFFLLMAIVFPVAAIFHPVYTSPPMPQWKAKLFFSVFPFAMLVFFVLYVKVSKWFARNDLAFICERIQGAFQPEQVT